MNVQGKITQLLEKQTGQKKDGSGEWVKQNFLVETEEKYNNLYCFEVFGADKVDNLNKFNKVGDVVNVEFNVQTNEWQGKYFTSLQAWLIKKVDAGSAVDQYQKQADQFDPEANQDDLPF